MTKHRITGLLIFTKDQLPAEDHTPICLSAEKQPSIWTPKGFLNSHATVVPDIGEPYFYQKIEVSPRVNVSAVPQLSPFRYPGGKTWFMPLLNQWLESLQPLAEFVEPFAGGGIASLTAASIPYAEHVTMVELDEDVASVWRVLLEGDGETFAERVAAFDIEDAGQVLDTAGGIMTLEERAFRTILRNRINRGGILAPGAGRLKEGERNRGIRSRWYPRTLRRRFLQIVALRNRVTFLQEDGIELLRAMLDREDAAFFIDPPYIGKDRRGRGKRLYRHWNVDHEKLFWLASRLRGNLLMTYDDTQEIRDLADAYGLQTRIVAMVNAHHERKRELVIAHNFGWIRSSAVAVFHSDPRASLFDLLTPEDFDH